MSARVLILAEDSVSAVRDPAGRSTAPASTSAPTPLPRSSCLDERRPEQAVTRIAELRAAHPAAKLILLAPRLEPEWLAQVTASGADAVVRKTADSHRTSALVRDIAMGRSLPRLRPGHRAGGRTAP